MILSPQWLDVLLGFRVVEVDDCLFDLLLPTLTILHESLFYIRKISQEGEGVIYKRDEIENNKSDLLPKTDIEVLETFDEKIATYNRDLEIQSNAGKRQMTRIRIRELTEQKEKIDIKWIKLLSMSDEGLSSTAQTHYCFYKCIHYHKDKTLVWDSFDDYLDDTDTTFIRKLMTLFLEFTNEFTDTELRKIARISFYRVMDQISKEHFIAPFESMADMSIESMKLLYWITYYNNALQNTSEECPIGVLEDDEAFDAWVDRQKKSISDPVSEVSSSSNVNKIRGKTRERIIVG